MAGAGPVRRRDERGSRSSSAVMCRARAPGQGRRPAFTTALSDSGRPSRSTLKPARRRNTLTKNPSVPVRRGVINNPSSRHQHRAPKHEARSPSALATRPAAHGKSGMAREEIAHLRAVLLGQHRARDVGDAAARLDQRGRAVERLGLLLARSRARRAAPATWRPDCAARCRCRCRAHRSARDRACPARSARTSAAAIAGSAPGRCARPRAPAAHGSARAGACRCRSHRSGPILHRGRERQRLAAGAGAEIDHLLARLCAGEQRRKLRALVLHLDQPLMKAGSAWIAGFLASAACADAQPERRPARPAADRDRQALQRACSRSLSAC